MDDTYRILGRARLVTSFPPLCDMVGNIFSRAVGCVAVQLPVVISTRLSKGEFQRWDLILESWQYMKRR